MVSQDISVESGQGFYLYLDKENAVPQPIARRRVPRRYPSWISRSHPGCDCSTNGQCVLEGLLPSNGWFDLALVLGQALHHSLAGR